MPEPEQRQRCERAVAHPRAVVAARARLERRPIAVHEDPADLRLERAQRFASRRRSLDVHAVELLAPCRNASALEPYHVRRLPSPATSRILRVGPLVRDRAGPVAQGDRQAHFALGSRRQVDRVGESCGCEAGRVLGGRVRRERARAQVLHDLTRVEGGSTEARGRRDREEAHVTVHPHRVPLSRDPRDPRDAA